MSTRAQTDSTSLLCVGRTVEEVFGGGEDAEVLGVRPVLHVPAELHHVLACQKRVLPAQQQRASELSQGAAGKVVEARAHPGTSWPLPCQAGSNALSAYFTQQIIMVALTQRGSRNRLI